jgi:exodeoxyribonuclease-3
MKIICWNVNGIRALHKKGNFKWLVDESPDFFCLQEVKAHPDQLIEDIKTIEGYFAYFDHSKIKKGYSGVAIYTKHKPIKVDYGMGIKEFDDEGRLLGLHYKDFVLFNIYFPNGGGGPVRLDYKLRFYDAFLDYIEKIHKTGKKIIFCGDVNTAHEAIDLARPKENEEHTGFLPEERAWVDEVVNHGYVDVFRFFYPDKKSGIYLLGSKERSPRTKRRLAHRLFLYF